MAELTETVATPGPGELLRTRAKADCCGHGGSGGRRRMPRDDVRETVRARSPRLRHGWRRAVGNARPGDDRRVRLGLYAERDATRRPRRRSARRLDVAFPLRWPISTKARQSSTWARAQAPTC